MNVGWVKKCVNKLKQYRDVTDMIIYNIFVDNNYNIKSFINSFQNWPW